MSEPRPDRQQPVPSAPMVNPSRAAGPAEGAERGWRPGLTPVTLILSLLVAYLLWQVQLILILLLFAIVFATLIERPVQLLERRHVPRAISILLVYVAIIAGLVLFFVGVAPVIRDQANLFREEAPMQILELRDRWRESPNPLLSGIGQDLLTRGIEIIEDPSTEVPVPEGAAEVAVGFVTGVGGGIIGALTALVITFYYLMEKRWLRQLILDQIRPTTRGRVARVWDNVESKVGDWMRGQLVLMLVIGVSATIGYGILGIRFWPLLGIWAGLTEIIPLVGPWLGGIPAVVIALTQGWNTALIVVGFIILLQTLENYILVPRIMRGAVGLSPMTVFLAILAGTQIYGVMGALLAIPVAAAVQVLISDYFQSRRNEYLPEAPDGPVSWRWMLGQRTSTAESSELSVPVDRSSEGQSGPETQTTPGPRKRRGWSRDMLTRSRKSDSETE